MEVLIVFEQLAPPTGTVVRRRAHDDGDSVLPVRAPFSGWLGLLSALERVIAVEQRSIDPEG